MKKIIFTLCIFQSCLLLQAQDPHFSQFFMSPQFTNPALVGIGSGDWRVMSNYRNQWGDAGTAFNTKTIAGDMTFTRKKVADNHLGLGLTFMTDESLQGAFRSTYASSSLAYQVKLDEYHHLGVGVQALFGNRFIDFSRLSFGEQFTSGGFDLALPSGETALANMKPFLSVGAGLLYSYNNKDNLNIDFGVAGFNLNQPRQTFLKDIREFLPASYVAHFNMEYVLSDRFLMSVNSIYKQQAVQNYFTFGGALGMEFSGGAQTHYLFAGLYFRKGDALYPYMGLQINNFQMGLSYDITTSSQVKGPVAPHSFEFSLVLKQPSKTPGAIPCPGVK
ncbi:MAG: PorP/SprF family type IX secretion system membrane protein [Chitinophagaceae bacterium]|nr:PorP/SprF family type IX secretion system membrane protein [Chitinophagaceae bacterium]